MKLLFISVAVSTFKSDQMLAMMTYANPATRERKKSLFNVRACDLGLSLVEISMKRVSEWTRAGSHELRSKRANTHIHSEKICPLPITVKAVQ